MLTVTIASDDGTLISFFILFSHTNVFTCYDVNLFFFSEEKRRQDHYIVYANPGLLWYLLHLIYFFLLFRHLLTSFSHIHPMCVTVRHDHDLTV